MQNCNLKFKNGAPPGLKASGVPCWAESRPASIRPAFGGAVLWRRDKMEPLGLKPEVPQGGILERSLSIPALKGKVFGRESINLERAIDFHGHLGPYLVLGLLMGELAIDKLKCRRHFGIEAIVRGTINKPKSCLIDGIQISSGCTYGKGNIKKIKGNRITVLFRSLQNSKKIKFYLKQGLIKRLNALKTHKASEDFAKELLKVNPKELFDLKF